MLLTPSQKLDNILFFWKWFSDVLGSADPNIILPKNFILLVILGALGNIMQIYGLYCIWPDPVKICNSLMLSTISFQLLFRLYERIQNDVGDATGLKDQIIELYKRCEEDSNYIEVLHSRIDIKGLVLKSYIFLSSITLLVPTFASWLFSMYQREYLLIAPFYLPFIDPDTLIGYVLNSGILAASAIMFQISFLAGDSIYIVIIFHAFVLVDIIGIKIKKLAKELDKSLDALESLEEKLKDASNFQQAKQIRLQICKARNNVAKTEDGFIEIIKDFEVYKDFTEKMIKMIGPASFGVITFNSIAIGMSLIVFRFSSYIIGLCFTVFFTFNLLISCVGGVIVEQQNERLLSYVSEFPWYKMSKSHQKIYLQFIHECQNAPNFKMLTIKNMNLKLLVDILYGGYSYLIVLLNFVKN